MRPIDADALIRTVRFLTLRDGKEIEIHYVEAERIDSAPTADAVPVELIKEMIARLRRRRMNLDDDCVDEAWDLKMQIEALDDLLSEWAERKEE